MKKVAGPLDEATLGDAGQSGLTGMQNSYQAPLLQIWKNVKKVAIIPKSLEDPVRTRVPRSLIRSNFPGIASDGRKERKTVEYAALSRFFRDWRGRLSSWHLQYAGNCVNILEKYATPHCRCDACMLFAHWQGCTTMRAQHSIC